MGDNLGKLALVQPDAFAARTMVDDHPLFYHFKQLTLTSWTNHD
jgi:hypothetical protein